MTPREMVQQKSAAISFREHLAEIARKAGWQSDVSLMRVVAPDWLMICGNLSGISYLHTANGQMVVHSELPPDVVKILINDRP